jgi:hypothetical protein
MNSIGKEVIVSVLRATSRAFAVKWVEAFKWVGGCEIGMPDFFNREVDPEAREAGGLFWVQRRGLERALKVREFRRVVLRPACISCP